MGNSKSSPSGSGRKGKGNTENQQPPPDTNEDRSRYKHPCEHERTLCLKDGIDINRYSLKIKPDKDPTKFCLEFTYDAHVDGSITIHFFEIGGEDYNMDPITKKLIEPIEVKVEKGLGKRYIQDEGKGVSLPLHKFRLTEVYHLAIKSHSDSLVVSENSRSQPTLSQSTLAVFQIDQDKCQVRVTNQIVWWKGRKYVLHGVTATGLPDYTYCGGNDPCIDCPICKSRDDAGKGRQIGKLWVSNSIIGRWSNGTAVCEGTYECRKVAVKKIDKANHAVADKEFEILKKTDHRSNIVRFYCKEEDEDFVYIALEWCECSLHDLISHCSSLETGLKLQLKGFGGDLKLVKPNGYPSELMLQIWRDIATGLAHLHDLGLVHGDLNEKNVLICIDTSNTAKVPVLTAKVSVLGISSLPADGSSLSKSMTGSASLGGRTHNQLQNEGQTQDADLFRLGSLLFFCLSGGKRLLSDEEYGRIQSKEGYGKLSDLENIPEAYDLISSLRNPDPKSRLKAAQVLSHPLFWTPKTRVDFLACVSDNLESGGHNFVHRNDLIKTSRGYDDWIWKFNQKEWDSIENWYTWPSDDVWGLLRLIRNISGHPRTKTAFLKKLAVPNGLDECFSTKFPALVMDVYKFFKQHPPNEREALHMYYKPYQFNVQIY